MIEKDWEELGVKVAVKDANTVFERSLSLVCKYKYKYSYGLVRSEVCNCTLHKVTMIAL